MAASMLFMRLNYSSLVIVFWVRHSLAIKILNFAKSQFVGHEFKNMLEILIKLFQLIANYWVQATTWYSRIDAAL
ncbi:hypothetical protein DCO16_03230 [Polynucleobacter antarcticus]|uniref:Uncharacterized protein n=1 Tax=Polynucleobacter antarcticus TaxID=1743162 RepID=A0A6M9PTQ8_9BURK|nr:hypothetical protein DCO16_03230 [Polynucleobacter antarcticus]